MAEYNLWDDRTVEDNDEHFCPLLNDRCYASEVDCRDCEVQIEGELKMSKIIDNEWLEKEMTEAKIDMPLEDVYRHIKESYLHHKLERNAVFLPKAELMALMCIQKVIAENEEEISELPNIIDNGDKIDGYAYSYKTDSEGVLYINIDSVRAMLTKAADVQPIRRGRWIVNEVAEKPETSGVYNVLYRTDEGDFVTSCYFDGADTWYHDVGINHDRIATDKVMMWQSLPEKPREARNNE